MALSRSQSVFSFRSTQGNYLYTFDIVMDGQGNISVRNIVTPYGLLMDTTNSLPESVLDDIRSAITQVEDLVAQTSAINGILTFASESTKTYTFATAFASTDYRVHFDTEDFVLVRVTKDLTGFTVELSSVYTGQIGFDVFV